MYNFNIPVVDTDSLTICKKDNTEFSKEELTKLTKEINKLTDDLIIWDLEFYIPKIIVLASKNYILYDGKKIKTKGSSLRDVKKEPALREFLDSCIKLLVEDAPQEQLVETYNKYVKEALNVTDIKRWCSKKTITTAVETSERANETKVKDAIAGSEYTQGDKVYLFFDEDETLVLAERFKGSYNKDRLIEKLYKVTQVFKSILPVKELFLNYSLKRNKKLLETLT